MKSSMENEYPEWIYKKREPIQVKGLTIAPAPSERRIDDRKAVYNIMVGMVGSDQAKYDAIIDYFRRKYEGEPYIGLGKKARNELYIKYKGRCMWCKERVGLHEFTVEHIKPRVEGGTDDWENLGVAHEKCNGLRSNVLIYKGQYNDEYEKENNKAEGTGDDRGSEDQRLLPTTG